MLYLVGSRLFGNHSEFSDYDFIGENNAENLDYITNVLGLKKVEHSKFNQYYGRHEGKLYDIVLHDDLWPRLQAREYMMSLPEVYHMPHSERTKLLKELITFYEEHYVGI